MNVFNQRKGPIMQLANGKRKLQSRTNPLAISHKTSH